MKLVFRIAIWANGLVALAAFLFAFTVLGAEIFGETGFARGALLSAAFSGVTAAIWVVLLAIRFYWRAMLMADV